MQDPHNPTRRPRLTAVEVETLILDGIQAALTRDGLSPTTRSKEELEKAVFHGMIDGATALMNEFLARVRSSHPPTQLSSWATQQADRGAASAMREACQVWHSAVRKVQKASQLMSYAGCRAIDPRVFPLVLAEVRPDSFTALYEAHAFISFDLPASVLEIVEKTRAKWQAQEDQAAREAQRELFFSLIAARMFR